MIEPIDAFLGATGNLLIDLWLYMVLGFLVAGVVEEFVSNDTLLDYGGVPDPRNDHDAACRPRSSDPLVGSNSTDKEDLSKKDAPNRGAGGGGTARGI